MSLATAETPVAATETIVSLDRDHLVVGRRLNGPVTGTDNRVLLPAGQPISVAFKASPTPLRVRLQKSDVPRATLPRDLAAAVAPPPLFSADLTRRLDGIVSSGLLVLVANRGPAVRDSLVLHGAKLYDRAARDRLVEQLSCLSSSLDGLVQNALHGRSVDGQAVLTTISQYVAELSESELVTQVVAEAAGHSELVEHAVQVSVLGMALASEMGLDAESIRKIGVVGLFENWGMFRVDSGTWKAPFELTPQERIAIHRHPINSLEILQGITGIPNVVPLVAYQMHERMNGTGYPRGRSGNSIHPFARILQVADAYLALTSPRPWRPAIMPYVAMEYLVRQAQQKAYDGQVVRCLLGILSLFPIGSFVSLSDASAARVVRRNPSNFALPTVELLQTADGAPVPADAPGRTVDLSDEKLKIVQALVSPLRPELSYVPPAGDVPAPIGT